MAEIATLAGPDTAAAETVLRAAFAPYVGRLGRAQAADAYAWLPAAVDEGRVFGLRDGERLVGVIVTSRGDDGWTLEQVAVDPQCQGQGIGSRLIHHVEALARAEQVPALFLDTAAMMDDLLRLYGRHGFRELRRGRPAHGRDPHERVYMIKRLPADC